MIACLAEVEKWQPEAIRDVERAARQSGAAALDARSQLDNLPFADWSGAAADAARTSNDELGRRLAAHGNSMRVIEAAAAKAADDVAVLRRTLSLLYTDADQWGFAIDALTNSVSAVRKTPKSLQSELVDRVEKLLATANTVDDELAQVIDFADGDLPVPAFRDDVQAILAGKAHPPVDPTRFGSWWRRLTQLEKDALWEHDQYLGNHGGMPAADRDHYNRRKLEDEYTRAALAHTTDFDDLRILREQLDHPDRLLLLLDTQSGERPHAAIAQGNPDTADHVATYVPGTKSRLSEMAEDMVRVDAMRESAGSAASVIAWFGYDSPQGLWDDAPQKEYAEAAAPKLERFQDGLRASHEGPPSINTVIGHSYGTTVVGAAASNGHVLNADQVVFVASPGTAVDHVSEMRLTGIAPSDNGEHVFATKAAHDPVPLYSHAHNGPAAEILVGGVTSMPFIGLGAGGLLRSKQMSTDDFGIDPTSDEFGGVTFRSDPGTATALPGFDTYHPSAHSEYWTPGNAALENLGSIIAGRGRVR